MSNIDQPKSRRIITAKGVSTEFFDGIKSEWAIGQMVRKGQIPNFRIGRLIFFEEETLRAWAAEQMQESIKSVENIKNGIRRIK